MDIITILVYVIVSIVVGLTAIGIATGIASLNLAIPFLNTYFLATQAENNLSLRWIFFLSGALIILMAIRFVQIVAQRGHHDKALIFNTQHGPIHITLFAIEDMIKKTLGINSELSDVRPRVDSEKNELQVLIRTNIAADVNVLGVTKEVQAKIHDTLTQVLGSDQPMRIKIEIRKMILSKKKKEEIAKPSQENYVE